MNTSSLFFYCSVHPCIFFFSTSCIITDSLHLPSSGEDPTASKCRHGNLDKNPHLSLSDIKAPQIVAILSEVLQKDWNTITISSSASGDRALANHGNMLTSERSVLQKHHPTLGGPGIAFIFNLEICWNGRDAAANSSFAFPAAKTKPKTSP